MLNGKVYISEKIDGSNTSIWYENGMIYCGSRNRIVYDGNIIDSFRGFVDYVTNSSMAARFERLFEESPNYRLFGEFLVPHTIQYPKEYYNQFYLFDISDRNKETEDELHFLPYEEVKQIAEFYGIKYIPIFDIIEDPTYEDIKKYLGKSNFGVKGEGLVLKNYDFVNKFGRISYGKIVTEDFTESHKIVQGGSKNAPIEDQIVWKYITYARVSKIAEKYELSKMEDVPKLFGLVFHDLIEEEIWEIIKKYKKPTINFKKLYKTMEKSAKKYYIDYLNNVEPVECS